MNGGPPSTIGKSIALIERNDPNVKLACVLDPGPFKLAELQRLTAALQANEHLETFLNSGELPIALEIGEFESFVRALKSIPTLRTLILSCVLDASKVGVLAEVLIRNNSTPLHLTILGSRGIDCEGARRIADALPSSGLFGLSLGGNRGIGDDGAEALAGALVEGRRPAGRKDASLQTLGLPECGISQRGTNAIMSAVKKNVTLTSLQLDGANTAFLDKAVRECNRSIISIQEIRTDHTGGVPSTPSETVTNFLRRNEHIGNVLRRIVPTEHERYWESPVHANLVHANLMLPLNNEEGRQYRDREERERRQRQRQQECNDGKAFKEGSSMMPGLWGDLLGSVSQNRDSIFMVLKEYTDTIFEEPGDVEPQQAADVREP